MTAPAMAPAMPMGAAPAAPRHAERAAPLLLGALVGALVAGRIEVGIGCTAIAAAAAVSVGSAWPGRRWWGLIGTGTLLSLVLNAYLVDGIAVVGPAIAGRAPTGEGIRLGLLLSLRVFGAAVAVHGLAAAWPGERAADEVARMLRPLERLRVPVSEGRVIMGLALRFVPLLAFEIRRIRALQAMRSGGGPKGAIERIRRLQAVVVPAVVGALERAERVALTLEARHYRVRPVARGRPAWAWVTAGVAVAVAALVWRT